MRWVWELYAPRVGDFAAALDRFDLLIGEVAKLSLVFLGGASDPVESLLARIHDAPDVRKWSRHPTVPSSWVDPTGTRWHFTGEPLADAGEVMRSGYRPNWWVACLPHLFQRAASYLQAVAAAAAAFGTVPVTAVAPSENPAKVGEPAEPLKPGWNIELRVFSFGVWSHEFVRSAPSQERVLTAFQEAGWPRRVSKGLPDHLSGILRNMGATLGVDCPVEFEGDGTGGVRWRPKGERRQVSDM